jgi:hypothetical protein
MDARQGELPEVRQLKKSKQPLEFSQFARVYKAGPPKVAVDRPGRVADILGAFLCALPGIRAAVRAAELVQVEAMLAVMLFLVTAGSDDNDQVGATRAQIGCLPAGELARFTMIFRS